MQVIASAAVVAGIAHHLFAGRHDHNLRLNRFVPATEAIEERQAISHIKANVRSKAAVLFQRFPPGVTIPPATEFTGHLRLLIRRQIAGIR